MKYVLGIITLVIGLFLNFLIFTKQGLLIIEKYELNLFYPIIVGVVALIVSIVVLLKCKEKILSSLSILTNGVFLVYLVFMLTSV